MGPAGACGRSVPAASAEDGALEVSPQQEEKAGLGGVHVLGEHLMRLEAAERARVRAVCYALAGIRRGPTNGVELPEGRSPLFWAMLSPAWSPELNTRLLMMG